MSASWKPRALEADDLPAALAAWAQAHPEGSTCAGDPALSTLSGLVSGQGNGEAHVVVHEGEPIALGIARCWGRVGQVHGLIVAEPFRRRGVGGALLDSLLAALARHDAAVVGIEVDSGGAAALTFLARAGFRPMHLSFVLERTLAPVDAAEPSEPAETGGDLVMLSGPDGIDGLSVVRALSTSVDSDFDPTSWLEQRLLAGDAEVALLAPKVGEAEPAGAHVGYAVLPRADADTLFVSMAIALDGPPHAGLRRMMAGLEALAVTRGCSRIQVAAPSRYWDATLALLDGGYRPRTSFLRLTRQGVPERADTRRCYLTSWR